METEPPAGRVTPGMLGPVTAWGADGAELDLKGPRHRAVLARLAVARGRLVPLGVVIEDLWETPPAGATGAIRTFVSALRRAIEPGRSSRTGYHPLQEQGDFAGARASYEREIESGHTKAASEARRRLLTRP